MKCLSRNSSSVTSRLTDTVKGETCAELKRSKKSAGASCSPSSISRQSADAHKGPHNKENQQEKPVSTEVLSEDELILGSSSLSEDSGYLSLYNSHIEQEQGDPDSTVAEPAQRCTGQTESRLSAGVPSDLKHSYLPIQRFQEEVCKELAKSYRKNQRYDWSVVSKLAENHSLYNVIGTKMGLDYVDILCCLLKKNMKHILTRILRLLGESDLINCKKVSRTWQNIIQQDRQALQRSKTAEERLKLQNTGRSERSLTRDFGLNRVVFSCLQTVASSTPVHKARKPINQKDAPVTTTKPSRFAEFQEAAKSLKNHEALRCCRRCGSPARYDSGIQRAVCLRASCSFDFCWICMSGYHGSTPCQRGTVRQSSRCQTESLAGTARSKRNVRRL